jgi:hypothetical protein
MSETEKELNIDVEDVDKEEDLMFGYGSSSEEPIDLLSDYLPERDDYAAKTVITKEQVHLLAALEQLSVLFDELDEYDRVIQEWIKAYEKRLTSVHGLSRDEFVKILVAMQGGSVDSESQRGMLEKVLNSNIGEDDK